MSQADERRGPSSLAYGVAFILVCVVMTMVLEDAAPLRDASDELVRLARQLGITALALALGHLAGLAAKRLFSSVRYGQRVRIRRAGLPAAAELPQEPLGTIVSLRGRIVQTGYGPRRMLSVRLDTPELGADGRPVTQPDGTICYVTIDVLEDHLERVLDVEVASSNVEAG